MFCYNRPFNAYQKSDITRTLKVNIRIAANNPKIFLVIPNILFYFTFYKHNLVLLLIKAVP